MKPGKLGFRNTKKLFVVLLGAQLPLMFSCEDKFLKQTTADKTAAISTLQTTLDDAGNHVASFDPTKSETQVMRITSGAIAGAAVAIPPAALSIPVAVTVGEGVSLTSTSFSNTLGLSDNKLTAGGPSVSFTASQDVVASNPMTLSIPFGALSFALADIDTENLVVMYRWTKVENGEPTFEAGVLPGHSVTRGSNKVSFQTTRFGTFQVGLAEKKITTSLTAKSDEPPALKSCERYAAAVYPTCTKDGQVGCVTTDAFKAADMTLAKSEFIITGMKIADVPGNVTLPPVGKVLTGTQFGASGTGSTGTLTLPSAANVLADTGTYGDPGALVTPSLSHRGTWNLTTSFPGAGYYAGVSNSPAATTIASGTTITGVAGLAALRPADCSADGGVGCVVVGPSFAAASTTDAASKILSGQKVAGVLGNVTLPSVGKVLTGTQYGVSGAGSTGTLTLPSASNVLAGSGIYGDPGAAITPLLANKGSWDLTQTFPGQGYYSAVTTPLSSTYPSTISIAGVPGTAIINTPSQCNFPGQNSCMVPSTGYYAGTICYMGGSACYLPQYSTNTPPQPLKAINYDDIASNAQNIRAPRIIGGVTGTLPDCTTNAATGCVTTSTYKSADLTNLSAGNIKSGVTIAGTTGQYPSSVFALAGADTTVDLSDNQATRESQLRSATNFEFFKSDGTRVVASGDGNITATNIKDQVAIFGLTGSLVTPDAWDLRVGRTINGVTGKLKVNCRNRVNTSIYNYDGAISNISTAAVTAGSTIDIWDTIDDSNNNFSGLPQSIVSTWSNRTDCGGVEATAGDDNVWKDATTTSTGTPSSCNAETTRCTMQDKITGLFWSKLQPSSVTWSAAWSTCANLTHNGQTGWRLPTQKEMLEAYSHGIRSAANQSWISESSMAYFYWSGSTASSNSINAWTVHLATGSVSSNAKTAQYYYVCVR